MEVDSLHPTGNLAPVRVAPEEQAMVLHHSEIHLSFSYHFRATKPVGICCKEEQSPEKCPRTGREHHLLPPPQQKPVTVGEKPAKGSATQPTPQHHL